MDALRITEFFFESSNELPDSGVSVKKIHLSLLICNQFCLGCSGEWFSGEKSGKLIRYPYHKYKKRINAIMTEFKFT